MSRSIYGDLHQVLLWWQPYILASFVKFWFVDIPSKKRSDDTMLAVNDRFFEIIVGVVSEYGIRRTTMSRLAQNLAVSRQTLYERFGDKDGIMAAAIDHLGVRTGKALHAAFDGVDDLGTCLDLYLSECVLPSYEAIQRQPDVADLHRGLGPKSTAASQSVKQIKVEILTALFAKHLVGKSTRPEDLARFFEESCFSALWVDQPREKFDAHIQVLRDAVLALARAG